MKKYLVLFMVILLTGCSAPGAALLGPAFTGATTKSVARASLSFGTNQIMKKVDINEKKSKIEGSSTNNECFTSIVHPRLSNDSHC